MLIECSEVLCIVEGRRKLEDAILFINLYGGKSSKWHSLVSCKLTSLLNCNDVMIVWSVPIRYKGDH